MSVPAGVKVEHILLEVGKLTAALNKLAAESNATQDMVRELFSKHFPTVSRLMSYYHIYPRDVW